MRLWLRLTLWMAGLTLVPLVVTGVLAVRTATENATLRPEEAMSRDASTLATLVGSWVDAEARMIVGWQSVWDLTDRDDSYRIGLLRATYKAMEEAVTVGLVDAAGRPVVPAQYLNTVDAGLASREAGSVARADMLLAKASRSLNADHYAFGTPYLPPDATTPVVPITASLRDDGPFMVAEVSLARISEVFASRTDTAAVLVDGYGQIILGSDHPYLRESDLNELLDLGLDLTFSTRRGDDVLQGAVWAVPYTDWKVVVLAPPTLAAKAASTIRNQTMRIAGLALFVVLLVGLAIERTLTRSVHDLQAHASQVTRGDYRQRNLVDRSDEIGELGLALNLMSARLEQGAAEISAFQRELQARVEARTKQLEAAQAQLVRAGQMAAVAELGAGLAHELNNPLAAILGHVQLLRERGEAVPPEALARLEDHAQRCREVVDTMVRLEAGQVDPSEARVVDLKVILGESVAGVRPAFDERGVGLDVVTLEDALPVRMDAALARRVLSQLLEALCAGLDEGARLRVEAVQRDGITLLLTPNRPVAEGPAADNWRAAGMRLWAARGLLELSGGQILAPDDTSSAWRAVFPGSA